MNTIINSTGVSTPIAKEKIVAMLQKAETIEDTSRETPEGGAETNAAAAVKAAVKAKEAQGQPPIVPLYRKGNSTAVEYYAPKTGISASLRPTELRAENLRALASLDEIARWICLECMEKDPKWGENNEKEVMLEARNRLIDMSREVDLDDPEQHRKNGVWSEDVDGEPGYVYNAGKKCYFVSASGGKLREVSGNQWHYQFTKEVPMPDPIDNALQPSEVAGLTDFLAARPWEMDGQVCGKLLVGWVVNSILAGVVQKRPHIWVTAPAATGKTFLHNDILTMLGFRRDSDNGIGIILEGATTTAAGVRQKINSRAVPVVFDELENNGAYRVNANIEGILNLMRTAYSSQTGTFSMGGEDGNAKSYMVRCGFLCFSVHSKLDKETDYGRCLELRMVQLPDSKKKEIWARQEEGRAMIKKKDFTGRLIYTVMQRAQVIQRIEEELEEHLKNTQGEVGARRAELFAHLLAGYFALSKEGGELSADDKEEAMECVRAYVATEEVSSEFEECLATLLGHTEFVSGQQRSVGQLIRIAWWVMAKKEVSTHPRIDDYEIAADAALDALGVSWVMHNEQPCLCLFPYNKTLNNKVFGMTRWKDKLRRVLGANCKEDGLPNEQGVMLSSARDGGRPKKALFLPEELFIADPEALWEAAREN